MKPNILNPEWKYVPASRTNIKATFRRVRKQMQEQKSVVVHLAGGANRRQAKS